MLRQDWVREQFFVVIYLSADNCDHCAEDQKRHKRESKSLYWLGQAGISFEWQKIGPTTNLSILDNPFRYFAFFFIVEE